MPSSFIESFHDSKPVNQIAQSDDVASSQSMAFTRRAEKLVADVFIKLGLGLADNNPVVVDDHRNVRVLIAEGCKLSTLARLPESGMAQDFSISAYEYAIEVEFVLSDSLTF